MHQCRYDVVVAGGGPSGITAAIAAAREGAKTLIVERYGFLGGMSTIACVYPWQSFHDLAGRQSVAGLAQSIVDRLMEMGGSPGHLRDTIGWAYSVTPFDAELFRVLADEMMREAGVDVALHSVVSGATVHSGRIASIEVTCKTSKWQIEGQVFIDATGDADLAYFAGVPYEEGRPSDGLAQPMTMNFQMGGVRMEDVVAYMKSHPNEFHKTSLIGELGKIPLTGVSGFFSLWNEYGPKEVPRDRVLFFVGIRPGEVHVNTSRVFGCYGTDPLNLGSAEAEGRRQVQALVRFFRRHLPGFSDAYLIRTATQIGVRESRRIVGEYVLTREDIINGRSFPDCIARGGYPIDIHDPAGRSYSVGEDHPAPGYGIPFRCLVPRSAENLLIVGRCISASHEALGATRVTPVCMALGEAAGTASGMCSSRRQAPQEVNVEAVRQKLTGYGAIV